MLSFKCLSCIIVRLEHCIEPLVSGNVPDMILNSRLGKGPLMKREKGLSINGCQLTSHAITEHTEGTEFMGIILSLEANSNVQHCLYSVI